MIRFVRASVEDAETLTKIMTYAFDEDSRKFADIPKNGPPGYDMVEWHTFLMQKGFYYKILSDEYIIGGFTVFNLGDGHYRLGTIYIHPDFQNKGIGTQAVKFIEKTFPQAKEWSLDTASWARRNHHFYEKLGYVKVGETKTENHFEKPEAFLYEKKMKKTSQ